MKLPAFQFYPGDWMKDPNLRRCSQAARGVWVDMLCLMFECEQRGVLATGGSPWSREDAAAAVGGNTDVTLRCIDELVSKGVCKVREDGALYSKRQLKDEETRVSTRERVAKFRQKHEGNASGNADVTPKKHPSSPSLSTSTTVNQPPPAAPAGAEPKKPRARNLLIDELATIEGIPLAEIGEAVAKRLNSQLTIIKQSSPDVTPEELRRRATNYRTHYKTASLTATALAKHWGLCHAPNAFADTGAKIYKAPFA